MRGSPTFDGIAATNIDLGYYEAEAKPKVFEIEAVVGARSAIQFFVLGLPTWLKDVSSGEFPGVGFGPVEITGPLFDQWPPESHQRLLGNVDLKHGKLEDAEPILRRFMSGPFAGPPPMTKRPAIWRWSKGGSRRARSFETSLRAGLAAVLCSPNFSIFARTSTKRRSRISDYELASRMSYFLWSSMPDAELLMCPTRNAA